MLFSIFYLAGDDSRPLPDLQPGAWNRDLQRPDLSEWGLWAADRTRKSFVRDV